MSVRRISWPPTAADSPQRLSRAPSSNGAAASALCMLSASGHVRALSMCLLQALTLRPALTLQSCQLQS